MGGLLLLAACSTQAPLAPTGAHVLRAGFDEQTAAAQMGTGPARVEGSAQAAAPDGSEATCAGAPAVLIPVTDYATERLAAIYGSAPGEGQVRRLGGEQAAQRPVKFYPDLPEYKTFSRETVCDASGRFEFLNIRDGVYYLFALVVWREQPFDGRLYATRVNVHDGRPASVALGDR